MRIEATPEELQRAYVATDGDPAWSASRSLMEQGKLPSEMFRSLAVRPDILGALSGFGTAVYPGGLLERSLKERVIIAVSKYNDCQYCVGSHSSTAARLGILDAVTPTERERFALEYAHAALQDANAIPDTLFERLQTVFTREEIVELTMLVGLTQMLNLFNNSLENLYNDDYASVAPDGTRERK